MTNVSESHHPLVLHKLSRLRDVKTDPKKDDVKQDDKKKDEQKKDDGNVNDDNKPKDGDVKVPPQKQ